MENTELKNLINKLNDLEIIQTSIDWFEDLPEDIWEEYFKNNHKAVAQNLDIDTRRWYENSVSVYRIVGGFLGVRFVSNKFSEMDSVSDYCWTLRFFEMEEFTTISYREK